MHGQRSFNRSIISRLLVLLQGLTCIIASTNSDVNLAFGIMLYETEERGSSYTMNSFQRLLNAIYREDRHLYMLHVDAKTNSNLMIDLHENICDERSHNCGYIRPRKVAWGAPSVVEMNLGLIQAAYEFPQLQYKYTDPHQKRPCTAVRTSLPYTWDYFIFIGHESVPLMSIHYIEQWFSSVVHGIKPSLLSNIEEIEKQDKKYDTSEEATANELYHIYPSGTNFINCWDGALGHDFFGQREDVVDRMKNVIVEAPEGYLMESLYWRDRHGEHHELKRSIPSRDVLKIYKTIQYVTLTHEASRHVIYSPDSRRVLLYLANVKASDELVVPTIFFTNDTLAATATCDTTLHFTHWARPGGSWHPESITMEHLPVILNNTKNLFIRKVQEISHEVLISLDEIRPLIWDDLSVHIEQSKSYLNTTTITNQKCQNSDIIPTSGDVVDIMECEKEDIETGTVEKRFLFDDESPRGISIKPVIIAPLQQNHILDQIPRSVIKRGIQHLIREAVGIPDNENNINKITEYKIGSSREKSYNSLKKLFLDRGDSSSYNRESDSSDLDALKELWKAWYSSDSINIDHVTIHDILIELNNLRQHKDDVQAENFREYWKNKWIRDRRELEAKDKRRREREEMEKTRNLLTEW